MLQNYPTNPMTSETTGFDGRTLWAQIEGVRDVLPDEDGLSAGDKRHLARDAQRLQTSIDAGRNLLMARLSVNSLKRVLGF